MLQTDEGDWILTQVIEDCPGVPEHTARRALTRAVKHFADSELVTPWLNVPTQCAVSSYPLEPYVCEGFRIIRIKNVKYCDRCINCVDDCHPCPSGYRVDDLHHITLMGSYVPQRNAENDLQVQAVLQVNNAYCKIPLDMATRYEEALIDGTMYYLLRQKDKSWSDPRLAAFYKQDFDGKLASAKCQVAGESGKQTQIIAGQCLL